MNYQNVLVPIDFSEDSLYAFKNSAIFAAPDRQLVLLHVLTAGDEANAMSLGRMHAVSRADMTVPEAPTDDAVRAQHLQRLQALAAPLDGVWRQVQTLAVVGEPTQTIIDTAKALSIDLVIMGSHGTGGLGRMLFGSTTYDVARKVGCSVLISKRV